MRLHRIALALLLVTAAGCAGRRARTGDGAAPSAAPDQRTRCCAQCTGAAARDPAGMDISQKTCNSYPAEWNGGPGIDDECRAWFAAQPATLTVGDCGRAPAD